MNTPVRSRAPQSRGHAQGEQHELAMTKIDALSLTKSHFLRLGQNRRLSGSLRRHAPLLLTRIARVDSLVSQLIRDLEGELKLAVRQVTVFLDDG
jgi:hypothetical protein